jgi:hypothetical protein
VATLSTAGPASAESATIAPQHAITGYSIADRHRRWKSGGWTYESWEWWGGCGCGCC